jgi:N-acetylmuramoyl-L-alanine amidase
MPWFPGADRSVPGNSPGGYKGGPPKFVVHTTEGGSASGAFSAYRANNTWPHVTIDQTTVYQHLDTSVSASAVLNESGGVETNRLFAIQAELVGYAADPKSHAMLERAAAFFEWAAGVHGIPAEWPNGRPQGRNGPHNRSSSNWTSKSGWYGHSQVPENSHWDPGYLSDEEIDILMGGVMEPIRVRINDADQTAAVKGGLHDANSWIDASDWCAYSRTPVPTFDNSTKDEDYAGTLSFWTHKTACQVMTTEGACGKPSVGLVAVPLPGAPGSTVLASLCADHEGAMTARRGKGMISG